MKPQLRSASVRSGSSSGSEVLSLSDELGSMSFMLEDKDKQAQAIWSQFVYCRFKNNNQPNKTSQEAPSEQKTEEKKTDHAQSKSVEQKPREVIQRAGRPHRSYKSKQIKKHVWALPASKEKQKALHIDRITDYLIGSKKEMEGQTISGAKNCKNYIEEFFCTFKTEHTHFLSYLLPPDEKESSEKGSQIIGEDGNLFDQAYRQLRNSRSSHASAKNADKDQGEIVEPSSKDQKRPLSPPETEKKKPKIPVLQDSFKYNPAKYRFVYCLKYPDFEITNTTRGEEALEVNESMLIIESLFPFRGLFRDILRNIFEHIRLRRLEQFSKHFDPDSFGNPNEALETHLTACRSYDSRVMSKVIDIHPRFSTESRIKPSKSSDSVPFKR